MFQLLFTQSPIFKWLKENFLTILLSLFFVGVLAFLVSTYYGMKSDLAESAEKITALSVTVDSQAKEIQARDNEIRQLKEDNRRIRAEAKITEESLEEARKAEKLVEVKYRDRVKIVTKKVEVIRDDPDLTAQEKDDAVSAVLIEDIWQGHCGLYAAEESPPECVSELVAPEPNEQTQTPPQPGDSQ